MLWSLAVVVQKEGIIVFKNVRETSERARRGFKAKKRLSSDVRG